MNSITMKKPLIISVAVHAVIIAGLYIVFLMGNRPHGINNQEINVDISTMSQPQKITEPPVIKHELADKVVDKIATTTAPQIPDSDASLSGGYQLIPKYPEGLRRRGIEGTVLLSVEILPTGGVGQIKIIQSAGYDSFDNSAIEAVKQWHFNPAVKNGIPISSWIKLPVKFTLQ